MKFRSKFDSIQASKAARAIKDLVQRDWHFASVGLSNCRAAQANRRELNEQLLIQSAALTNANFDSDEPRDRYGQWTTGDTSTTKTPTSPANNPPQSSQDQPPQAVLRPFTAWERLTFGLQQLKFKLLPGTRPDGQPSPGKVLGAAAMLLPFGMGEATIAKLLPEAAALRLGKVLPLIANTKLSRLLLGYFTAKTASDQPVYYHAIHQELAQGNYTDAIRTTIEDALQLAMIAAGVAGERGGPAPETTGPYSHFEDPPSVGSGKNFTRTQRQKILNANAQGNDGAVRSDKSGRVLSKGQQSKKGIVPPANEAHIDHITAKSKGGSNSYKNAQVLARDENLKKSNK